MRTETAIKLLRNGDCMWEKLKGRYNLTDYQIALLRYLLFTFLSESSKLFFILFLYRRHLALCIATLLFLCCIRRTAGGFHCNTYAGCLFVSTGYAFLCLSLLPLISLTKTARILLCMVCILINYALAPVSSSKRPALSAAKKKRFKWISTGILASITDYDNDNWKMATVNSDGSEVWIYMTAVEAGESTEALFNNVTVNAGITEEWSSAAKTTTIYKCDADGNKLSIIDTTKEQYDPTVIYKDADGNIVSAGTLPTFNIKVTGFAVQASTFADYNEAQP